MTADDITTAVSPEPELPQPECTSCHGFGTGVVAEAVQELRFEVESGNLNDATAEAASVVLTALEKHHEQKES